MCSQVYVLKRVARGMFLGSIPKHKSTNLIRFFKTLCAEVYSVFNTRFSQSINLNYFLFHLCESIYENIILDSVLISPIKFHFWHLMCYFAKSSLLSEKQGTKVLLVAASCVWLSSLSASWPRSDCALISEPELVVELTF